MAPPFTKLTDLTGKQPSKKVDIPAQYSEENQSYNTFLQPHPVEVQGSCPFPPKLMVLTAVTFFPISFLLCPHLD